MSSHSLSPGPELLYKYRAGSKLNLNTLIRKKVWVPSFYSTNDVFESNYEFLISKELDYVHSSSSVLRNQYGAPVMGLATALGEPLTQEQKIIKQRAIREAADTVRKRMFNKGVYCLTTNPLSQTMWGDYADGGRGFCIEYQVPQSAHQQAEPLLTYVDYANAPMKIRWAWIDQYPEHVIVELMLTYKSLEWESQKEWRIIYSDGEREYDAPYPIRSIIVGAKVLDDNPVLKALRTSLPEIQLKRVCLVGGYSLALEDI
jgi:hypothetical protein